MRVWYLVEELRSHKVRFHKGKNRLQRGKKKRFQESPRGKLVFLMSKNLFILPSFMNNRLNEYRYLGLVISSHLEILISVLKIYLHVDVWQKPTQCCKAIILQLKIKRFTCSLIGTLLFHSGSFCSFLFHSFQLHYKVFLVWNYLFFTCCAWYLVHFQRTCKFWKNKKKLKPFFSSYFAPPFFSPLFFWTFDWTHVGAFWFTLHISDLTWFLPFSDSLRCVLVNFSEGANPALSYIHEFSHWLVIVFYL